MNSTVFFQNKLFRWPIKKNNKPKNNKPNKPILEGNKKKDFVIFGFGRYGTRHFFVN